MSHNLIIVVLIQLTLILSCNVNNPSEQMGGFEDRFMALVNKSIESIKRTSNAGFDVEIAKLKKATDDSKAMELIPYGGSILSVSKNGKPFMLVMSFDDGSYGVGVYNQQTGEVTTNITDKDGDGDFDDISYTVFKENGEELYRVWDMDWDGQPDMKFPNHGDMNVKLWYNGKWQDSVKQGNRRGLVIDGNWTKLKHVNGEWIPANVSH